MTRAIVLVLAVTGSVAAYAADLPPAIDVPALVRQLGSEDFAEREEATRQLTALKVKEVPQELLAALKSPKAEVRERAARIAMALRKRIELAQLPRGEQFAKNGQFDLYVASTAATDPKIKAEDENLWIPVFQIGKAVITKAETNDNRMPNGCPGMFQDLRTYRARQPRLRFIVSTEEYAPPDGYVRGYHRSILAAGVSETEPLCGMIVSRGPVSVKRVISQAIVLTTGDVVTTGDVSNSVVVCDGNVQIGGRVYNSSIIARGRISVKGWGDSDGRSSTLIAGGTVDAKQSLPPPVLLPGNDPDSLARNKLAIGYYEESCFKVHEKQTNPLGFITFFELHRVGLEVKVADKAVTVAKVATSSACEKAGLKVGDVVLDVGGKMPADAESLRRHLRNALAIGDASVKVQRGKDTLTVKVALPE